MNAERWPVDFDALKRGDVIPSERVERVYGVSREDRAYSLAAMRLAKLVSTFFRRERGENVVVVCVRDDIRILTHAEQARHVRRQERIRRRSYLRNIEAGAAVDTDALSDEERQAHEEWLLRASWRKQQILKPPPAPLTDDRTESDT